MRNQQAWGSSSLCLLLLLLLFLISGQYTGEARKDTVDKLKKLQKPLISRPEALATPLSNQLIMVVDDEGSSVVDGDHTISNIAVNRSVKMSSSVSADMRYSRFAVDGDESTFVETALEKFIPYLVVDLGAESYIDEITVISPFELGHLSAFVNDEMSLSFSRNESELSERSNWHTTALVYGTHVTLHTHATGRYVRIQRDTVSKLIISEIIVRGVRLNSREKALSHCLSGHNGLEVCSGRGICSGGKCDCGMLYAGGRCEGVRLSVFTTCSSFIIVAVFLFSILKRFRRKFNSRKRSGMLKKWDSEATDAEDKEKLAGKDSLEETRNRSLTPSLLPQQQSRMEEVYDPYKLHMLFSSPLVMITQHEVLPVAQLDVERECELLNRSLAQAGAQKRVKMEVTCATIDALQSILTLRETSVLHVSSHCQPDLIALEDADGAAHLVNIEALSNLLMASKPSLKFSRLVVLNCCHSEGVAAAFLKAGFEHVVCLSESYRVRDATAATFTRAFYLALASEHTVGDAHKLAKEAVSLCPGSFPGEAAAFLLLPDSSSHDEVLWPKPVGMVSPSGTGSFANNLFPNPSSVPGPCEDFVGRAHELWTLLRMIQRYRVVNLYGEHGCGKTTAAIQLANHIRLRKSESLFKDGVYLISVEQKIKYEHQVDGFGHEVVCAHICETLMSCLNKVPFHSALSPGSFRRSASKPNRESAFYKFGSEKPSSLIILDGVSQSVLDSKLFQECISMILRCSSKIYVVITSVHRYEKSAVRVVNVMCGPLSDLDAARLLIRLCHPRLIAPSVMRTEVEKLSSILNSVDDEFESSAIQLSKCSSVKSLKGHPETIRRLAAAVNAQASHGETFSLSDVELDQLWK